MGAKFKTLLRDPAKPIERYFNSPPKVLKQGAVICKFTGQIYACTIVNLSAECATIETLSHAALGNSVALLVIGEYIVYESEIFWKEENLIGLKFTEEPKKGRESLLQYL